MKDQERQQFALDTREFQRLEIALPVYLEVIGNSRDQVRLGEDTGHTAETIDLSLGGTALSSDIFLPKNATLCITIRDFPRPLTMAKAAAEPFSAEVIVRRVRMLDRTPRYLISGQFQELSDQAKAMLDALLGQHLPSGPTDDGAG